MSAALSVSIFRRRCEFSALVRPIWNCSTSKRPLYSTTVSKICSIRCESIRWPSASTTSCCMLGNSQDNPEVRMELGADDVTARGLAKESFRALKQLGPLCGADRLADVALGVFGDVD